MVFLHQMEGKLKVEDFLIEDMSVVEDVGEDGESEGRVLIRLTYHMLPSNVFKKVLIDEVWVPVDGVWTYQFDREKWDL